MPGKIRLKAFSFRPKKKQMTATTNSSIEKMISSHHFGGWVPAHMNGLCGSASLRLAFHCQGSQAGMDTDTSAPFLCEQANTGEATGEANWLPLCTRFVCNSYDAIVWFLLCSRSKKSEAWLPLQSAESGSRQQKN